MSEIDEEELELLRRRRLANLQKGASEEQRRAEAQEELENQKQNILRSILTPEARQRLANIKMVKRDFANQLEAQLIQLAQTGKLRIPISDSQLKQALTHLQSQRKDIKIRRI
jgi:programmed cell death protein 5